MAARRDTVTANAACTAMERAARWRRALGLLRAAAAPDAVTHSVCVIACARGLAWAAALGLLLRQARAGLPPDTVSRNNAMWGCHRAREWEAALRVHATMREHAVPLNASTYSAAVAAMDRPVGGGGVCVRGASLSAGLRRDAPREVEELAAELAALRRGARWRAALTAIIAHGGGGGGNASGEAAELAAAAMIGARRAQRRQ